MKHTPNIRVEPYRVTNGERSTTELDGNNGAFVIGRKGKDSLNVIVSDGSGWDHVSVSTPNRTPTWDEMQFVRNLFFHDDELAVQYSPPNKFHINCHQYCLHWWRCQTQAMPTPPMSMVGWKDEAKLNNQKEVEWFLTLIAPSELMTQLIYQSGQESMDVEEYALMLIKRAHAERVWPCKE